MERGENQNSYFSKTSHFRPHSSARFSEKQTAGGSATQRGRRHWVPARPLENIQTETERDYETLHLLKGEFSAVWPHIHPTRSKNLCEVTAAGPDLWQRLSAAAQWPSEGAVINSHQCGLKQALGLSWLLNSQHAHFSTKNNSDTHLLQFYSKLH